MTDNVTRIREALDAHGVESLTEPIGPGKFANVHDQLLYEDSLDGSGESAGDSTDGPFWAGTIIGPVAYCSAELHILTEDTTGFVGTNCFAGDAAADIFLRTWAGVLKELEDEDEDEDYEYATETGAVDGLGNVISDADPGL